METRLLQITSHFSEFLACSQATVHSKKLVLLGWLIMIIITNKWRHLKRIRLLEKRQSCVHKEKEQSWHLSRDENGY
jgi:hypothetical protein